MTARTILSRLALPLLAEMPYIVVSTLAMGWETMLNMLGRGTYYFDYHDATPQDLTGRVAIYLLAAYLAAALIHAAGRRWVKCALYTACLGLFAVRTFLATVFGMAISEQTALLLVETNATEVSGFLTTFALSPPALSAYAKVAAIAMLAVALEWAWRRAPQAAPGGLASLAAGLAAALLLPLGAGAATTYTLLARCDTAEEMALWRHRAFCRPNDPVTLTAYSLMAVGKMSGQMRRCVQVTEAALGGNTAPTDAPETLVLVIGESFIKSHASLYGYRFATTPTLDAEREAGRLTAFTDAVTPYRYTSKAIYNLLCTNDLSGGGKWCDSPFFPALFHSAGYNVWLWDNQYTPGDGRAMCEFTLNSFLRDTSLARLSYTAINDTAWAWDGNLVTDFLRHAAPRRRSLAVLHLWGQHTDAADRYPHTPAFTRFRGADYRRRREPWMTDAKRQAIAHYDNATLYNDHVLGLVLRALAGRDAALVYLSDHGEEVYDYRDHTGRDLSMTPQALHAYHDVPMMVWLSESFRARRPALAEAVRRAAGRPFLTSDLCHLLFRLGRLRTTYYRPERDILSPRYRTAPRLVQDNVPYD